MMQCKVAVILSLDEILMCDYLNESYRAGFSAVLFIMLYRLVLTFQSVGEISKCVYLNESYRAVLFCGAFYYAVQVGFCFSVCG